MKGARSIHIPDGITGLFSIDPSRARVNQAPERVIAREKERIEKEAMAAARKEVRAEIDAENKKQTELWKNLESSFEGFVQEAEQKIREQLINLSVRIAEIILHREVADSDMLKDVISETLEPLSDCQGAVIRLNPEDAERINALREERDYNNPEDKAVIVVDQTLRPGDVLIESRNGYFDARIEERLKILKEKLMERSRNDYANKS